MKRSDYWRSFGKKGTMGDPNGEIAVAMRQRERCQAGNHDIVEAVTDLCIRRPTGTVLIAKGTRYCAYCKTVPPATHEKMPELHKDGGGQ